MTDPRSVETIYSNVIEDTINKLTPEFENAGVPLPVLARLHQLWKMSMTNTVRAPLLEPTTPQIPIPRTNPYQNQPQTLPKPVNNPLNVAPSTSSDGATTQAIPSSTSSSHTMTDQNGIITAQSNETMGNNTNGTPSLDIRYTVPESDSNVVANPDPMLLNPQASQIGSEIKTEEIEASADSLNSTKNEFSTNLELSPSSDLTSQIPQPSSSTDAQKPSEQDEEDDDESSEVSSDSDMDDYADYKNSLICFFESMKRVKNKRKYTMSKGVLHIGGRDYLFKSGTGEFDWR